MLAIHAVGDDFERYLDLRPELPGVLFRVLDHENRPEALEGLGYPYSHSVVLSDTRGAWLRCLVLRATLEAITFGGLLLVVALPFSLVRRREFLYYALSIYTSLCLYVYTLLY